MTQTRHSPTEPAHLVRDLYRLLINRVDVSLRWHDGWYFQRRILTQDDLATAMSRPIPLGIAAVSGVGTSRWICFDSDRDDDLPAMTNLYEHLPEAARLFERSRRGAHVWCFIQPVDWGKANAYGCALAAERGVDTIEIFPKHGGLNAVRLPGTVHPKTGVRYPIVEPSTGEVLVLEHRLADIAPIAIPARQPRPDLSNQAGNLQRRSSDELIAVLSRITSIQEYAPGRAKGICPWHDDAHPSLFVANGRFRCFACGVWGDLWDVGRWVSKGVPPPV